MSLANMNPQSVAESIYVHNIDVCGIVAQFKPLSDQYDKLLKMSSKFMVSSLARSMTDYFTAFRKYRNAIDGEIIKLSFANSMVSALVSSLEKPNEFAVVLRGHLRIIDDLSDCSGAYQEFNMATHQLSLALTAYLGDLHQDPSLDAFEEKLEAKRLEITRALQALSKLEERVQLLRMYGNDAAKLKASLEARRNEVNSTIAKVEALLQEAIKNQKNTVQSSTRSFLFGLIRTSHSIIEQNDTGAQQQAYKARLEDLRRELSQINDSIQKSTSGQQDTVQLIGVVSETELATQHEYIHQLQGQEKDLLQRYEVARKTAFKAIDARLQAGNAKSEGEVGFGDMLNLSSQMATSLDFLRNFIVQLKNVVQIFNQTPEMEQPKATNYLQAIGFVIRIPIIANAFLNGTDRPRIMDDPIYQHQYIQVTQYRQLLLWKAREMGRFITEEVEQPDRNLQEPPCRMMNVDGYTPKFF